MGELTITRLAGPEIIPHLDEVAALRIEIFREFPYLYDGRLANERKYLSTYARSPEALIVVARDGERMVGASTGIPMCDESDEFKRPFALAGYDPDTLFYYGDVVLEKSYRGRGTGVRFFEECEAYVRSLKRFDTCLFCAVDRAPDHPKRPADYRPLDGFWIKRGFTRHPELRTHYKWKEVGEEGETPKQMTFWLKSLA